MGRKRLTGKEWAELGFCLFLLIYFSVLTFITPQYSSKAQLFPKVCLVAGFILIVLKFISLFVPRAKAFIEPEKKDNASTTADIPVETENKESAKYPIGNVVAVIGWLVLTSAAYYLIGIIPAAFICTLVFFLCITRIKWYKALALSASLVLVLYVVFNVLLKLRLYSGILW